MSGQPPNLSRRSFLRRTAAAVVAFSVLGTAAESLGTWYLELQDTNGPEDQQGLASLAAYGAPARLDVTSVRPEAHLPGDARVSLHCHHFRSFKAPAGRPRRCVILIPGWKDTATGTGFLDRARALLDADEDVVMVNLGASGPSSGVSWGMGTFEQHDVIAVYQAVLAHGYRPHSIGFVADSMGAAAVLGAIDNDQTGPGRNIREAAVYVLVAPYNRLRAVLEKVNALVPWVAAPAGWLSQLVFGDDPIDQQSLHHRTPGFTGNKVHIIYNPDDNVMPPSQETEIRQYEPAVHLDSVRFTDKGSANDVHQQLSALVGKPPLVAQIVHIVNQAFEGATVGIG